MFEGLKLVYKNNHELAQAREALEAAVEKGSADGMLCYQISRIVDVEPQDAAETMKLVEFWKANARVETVAERRYRVFSEVTGHPNIVII